MIDLNYLLLSFIVGMILTIIPTTKHKSPQIPTNKKKLYAEYMNSHQWRKVRRARLEKDRFKCKMWHVVPVKESLQVHHKSYKRLGKERLSDLVTVCRNCHNKIHKRK